VEYEKLLSELEKQGIDVIEMNLKGKAKGYYCDDTIVIDSKIETKAQKKSTLIEEVGHVKTSSGNILDDKDIKNVKQEKIARRWGYEYIIGLTDLINAFNAGVHGRYELAEYLNVTEQFLQETIDYYKEKYGTYYELDKYYICFSPCLSIIEKNNLKWLYNPYE